MKYPYLRLSVALAASVATVGLAGCGLISSDVTNFDLTLPDKKFTIDSARWQVDTIAADRYLQQPCSTSSSICSSAVQQACMTGCSGSCGATNTCDLSLDVSLWQPVDLVAEKPELKSINDEPAIKVTIDSVTYEVTSNTLNVDTPDISVYVAPTSALKPTDAQTSLIGTIAPVPAGWVTEHVEQLRFTTTGRSDLIKAMSSFKTPFNVLVGSSLLVTMGQPVPTGKLEAVVHIKGHAGL